MKRIEQRLRNPKPIVSGVASGMASKFGWSCFWTRLVWGFGVATNPTLGLLAYVAFALVGPKWSRHSR